MLEQLFALDKRLALSNERLAIGFEGYAAIHELINHYLGQYAAFNQLDATQIVNMYTDFSRIYQQHLNTFQKTGQYPFEYHDATVIDRQSYDIALILSCITSPARAGIVKLLLQCIDKLHDQKICVVGTGAGIELELMRQHSKSLDVTAYDTSLNSFTKQYFGRFTLREEYFSTPEQGSAYDTVFAIELLEHLTNPLEFISNTYAALAPGKQLICTTATNMPQFDHLYNFTDIDAFIKAVRKIGFTLVAHHELKQPYGFNKIEAKNDWFLLKK